MAVDLDKIRQKYKEVKEKKGGFDDIPWMELQQGDNLLRLVANEDGDFYFESGYHYLRNGKEVKAITCNKLTDGSECFLCDLVHELYKTKDPKDKELAKEIRSGARIFFNVIDRNDGNKLKVLGAGNMIFKEILKFFADEDWGDISDPVTGHDIVINKTGEKLDTEYTVMPKPKPTKIGVEVTDLFDLSAIPFLYTPDEQEAIFQGASEDEVRKARKGEDSDSSKKETKQTDKKPAPTAKKEEPKKSAPPARKPRNADPEEQFADKLAQVDMDIPKASKAVANWLADEDRTEDELDQIISKWGKEEEEPVAEQSPEDQYAEKIGQLDLSSPKAKKKYQDWLDNDGSEEGLDNLLEVYGKEDDAGDSKDEGGDALDSQIKDALARFKKDKTK
jgi:hypothetical protein